MNSKVSKIQAIIDTQDNGLNLSGIDSRKSFPLVNVLSRYRMIDFCLSNIVNSKINSVFIVIDKPNRHIFNYIDNGIFWDLNRINSGIKYLFAAGDTQNKKFSNIDAIFNNYTFLTEIDNNTEYVLFTNSDSVNRIDYEDMFKQLIENKADVIWAYKSIEIFDYNAENYKRAKILSFESNSKKIKTFGKNTFKNIKINLDIGIFILKKELFYQALIESMADNKINSIQEFIRNFYVSKWEIIGYEIKNFVGNFWTIEEYFRGQISLLLDEKNLSEILKPPLYTHEYNYSPSYYSKTANINNSLLGQNCVIDGEVINSIISNNVKIEKGAKVENCILLDNVIIKKNANLKNIIVDNDSIVSENKKIIAIEESPLVLKKSIHRKDQNEIIKVTR
ncbi:glucose-1-phosphate adenylyltransferase subunit GlgD [[Mycoplasma] mobile]|uniref:Divergent glucose-1-phosphate adenylyltransferase n=1 Tax=Mycoplasma mobile (strain ATCC 43663 / 163K / NCTC 11711) TaxID=267748 RepID=Q6KHP6_MYCM1|nr:glucose-1-phosphate adenylyltransferase subunit GlgD [[Mycoplasma] mobile]AAT27884.1 divergent glucose-1-phosphate adenylyltransferase [Mycoplasma mobile 163K]